MKNSFEKDLNNHLLNMILDQLKLSTFPPFIEKKGKLYYVGFPVKNKGK